MHTDGRWNRAKALAGLLLIALALGARGDPATPRQGVVQMSDGEILEGVISISPGRKIRIHANDELKTLELSMVREMQFSPHKESMERKWRFIEAGRTEKEFYGAPYPVRHINTSIVVPGADRLVGHVYTTVLYVQKDGNAQKVILHAKQRGKPGETLDDLRYPVRLAFHDDTNSAEDSLRVHVGQDAQHPVRDVAALTRGGLIRLPGKGKVRPRNGHFPPLSARTCSWPHAPTPPSPPPGRRRTSTAPTPAVTQALADAKDFFDRRDLLGVFTDAEGRDLYTLLMLVRAGNTTLGGEQTQPWRLGIWRWKQGRDDRLMLAGRGYLFRGITAKGTAPPRVVLTETMWRAGADTNGVLSLNPFATGQASPSEER